MVYTSRWVWSVATVDGLTGLALGWLIGRGTLPWWLLAPWFAACLTAGAWAGRRAARGRREVGR